MLASRNLAITYIHELGTDDVRKRILRTELHPPFDWPATPRANMPTGSTLLVIPESGDLDMESATTNSRSGLGDSVQEAEREDEWRANYNEAIESVGRGTPVHFDSVKETRSPGSEDRVLKYVLDSMHNDTSVGPSASVL